MRTIYTFLFSLSALTLSAAQPVSGEPALLSPCSIGLRADNVSVGSRGESIDINSHKWVFHGYLRQSDNSLLIYNAPGKLTVMGEAQKEINGEIMTVQEVEIADMFSRVLVSSDNEYIKVDPFTAYFNASTGLLYIANKQPLVSAGGYQWFLTARYTQLDDHSKTAIAPEGCYLPFKTGDDLSFIGQRLKIDGNEMWFDELIYGFNDPSDSKLKGYQFVDAGFWAYNSADGCFINVYDKEGALTYSDEEGFYFRGEWNEKELTISSPFGKQFEEPVNFEIDRDNMTVRGRNVSAGSYNDPMLYYCDLTADFKAVVENGDIIFSGKISDDGKSVTFERYWLTSEAQLGTEFAGSQKMNIVFDSSILADDSGIGNIAADNSNSPVEYFTLQGIRVDSPVSGTIVIRRQGTEVSKIIMR